MPKKKKTNYEEKYVSRVSGLFICEESKTPRIELVTANGDSSTHNCSLPLFKLLEKTQAHKNYRVNYTVYIDSSTDTAERVTSEPKVEYQAYQVEYEKDIRMPKESLFSAP